MSIVAGSQEISIRANWKLLTENSIDGYHAMTTHARYFDILMNTTGQFSTGRWAASGMTSETAMPFGVWRAMGQSGRAMDSRLVGEAGKSELGRQYDTLLERFGKERADRIALMNRNLFIFSESRPQRHHGFDGRTYFPMAPDYMVINAWALAAETTRLRGHANMPQHFLEFLARWICDAGRRRSPRALSARIQKFQGSVVERHLEGHGQGQAFV